MESRLEAETMDQMDAKNAARNSASTKRQTGKNGATITSTQQQASFQKSTLYIL